MVPNQQALVLGQGINYAGGIPNASLVAGISSIPRREITIRHRQRQRQGQLNFKCENNYSSGSIIRYSYNNNNTSKLGTVSPSTVAVPQVGVAVFLIKGNKLLLGRRLTPIGRDSYFPPGGHLEFGESFEECAAREVKEETGLDIHNIEFLTVANDIFSDGANPPEHRVVIFMRALPILLVPDHEQVPQNHEPEKCGGWDWYDWNNLPKPLFVQLENMLQGGFNPFPADQK
ncbi:hypothetical protein ACSBR1_006293 [Camellia fascicularis]